MGNICHALAMAAIVPEEQQQDCLNSLRGDTSSLRHMVEAANSRSPRASFLLVIDQLEEMFTYSVDVNRRDFALESLLTACALPDASISVVATIRSDLYGECAQNPRLAEALSSSQILLAPMSEDEIVGSHCPFPPKHSAFLLIPACPNLSSRT